MKWLNKKLSIYARKLKTAPAAYFDKKGGESALRLFHWTARHTPAYKKFLENNRVNPRLIRTIKDFKNIPITSKTSYLKKYPYLDLFPQKDISLATTISATSGTSGEPFYFPRGEEQDRQYEYIAELFLKNQFGADRKKTLGIISFGLGIWIGGIFTYKNFNRLAAKNYKLTLLPVGPNKDLFLKSLRKMGPHFDQIILMGLPPFIKDILDEARDYGIKWKDYRLKIMTATESFSEEFRDYLIKKAGIKNPFTDILNIYGTVELGTMAHETPLTTLIRRLSRRSPEICRKLFPDSSRLPTLAQYHPYLTYFEEVNGEVIASGYGSSTPLIRYSFPDRGGVIPFDQLVLKLKEAGVDIGKEIRKHDLEKLVWKLPLVYVYERKDSSATLLGINIYPEYIRHALERPEFSRLVTGKFTMITKIDKNQNQFLEINTELRKRRRETISLNEDIQKAVVSSLVKNSTEYNYLYNNSPLKYQNRLKPVMRFWPYEDQTHFKPGGKQKWAKNIA